MTSSPTGINCTSSSSSGSSTTNVCSAPFAQGSAVTLTETPASGSTFASWSGGCTGTTACSVTLSAATSVTATFGDHCKAASITLFCLRRRIARSTTISERCGSIGRTTGFPIRASTAYRNLIRRAALLRCKGQRQRFPAATSRTRRRIALWIPQIPSRRSISLPPAMRIRVRSGMKRTTIAGDYALGRVEHAGEAIPESQRISV